MSDFLDSILSDNEVIAREVEIDGQKGTIYFKRISAGERADLLKGQVFQFDAQNKGASMSMDSGEARERDQKLVWYSVCKEDGSRYFPSLAAVKKAKDRTVAALCRVAMEVNEEGDAGKS